MLAFCRLTTRKKGVSFGELYSEDNHAIKASLFKHKPVFGILVSLTAGNAP